jgi:hypothetical protein
MSGTYRHGRTYCQFTDCRRRAMRAVTVELPTDWQPTFGFRVVEVTVGTCVQHGRELERHAAALLEARGEHHDLVQVIADAVETDIAARRVIVEQEHALTECEGAVDYQRKRAERAEAELEIARTAEAAAS